MASQTTTAPTTSEVQDLAQADVELFDLDSLVKPATWSPNPMKTRLALNFKGIRHKVTNISYPDLAPVLSAKGFPPNATGYKYTSPAISHHAAGVNMMDSFPIALYLDKAFPDTKPLFPPNTGALPLARLVTNYMGELGASLMPLLLPKVPSVLDPRGKEYFERTRAERFGMPLSELCKDEEAAWNTVSEYLGEIAEILAEGQVNGHGPFFLGSVASYADLVVVAALHWFKIAGKAAFDRALACGPEGSLEKLYKACEGWTGGDFNL